MPITSQNALSTSAEEIFPVNYGVSFREVTNTDPAIVMYIGFSSGLTTSNGHILAPGKSMVLLDRDAKKSIWAIAASGTPSVSLFES